MIGLSGNTVIDVSDLAVAFQRNGQRIPVVNGISFQLRRGEILTILGESEREKALR